MAAAPDAHAGHPPPDSGFTASAPAARPPLVPWVLGVFVALVALNALGGLPEDVIASLPATQSAAAEGETMRFADAVRRTLRRRLLALTLHEGILRDEEMDIAGREELFDEARARRMPPWYAAAEAVGPGGRVVGGASACLG